jgi:HK97 family phage major capsid protein
MSDKMDALIQRMAELTETVKSGHTDPATLDWDTVSAKFQEQIDATVNARIKAELDARPVYKGHPIYAETVDKAIKAGGLNGNRYGSMVKHMAQSGYYTDWVGNKHKPIDLWLAYRLMSKGSLLMPDRVAPPSQDLQNAIKALTSTGTGTGDELVPTDLAAQLWEDVHLSNVLVSNLDRLAMTSNPMDLPNALGDVTFRKGTENVAFTAGDPATAKNTLTVTEVGAEVDWSYTLDEDAIVALMPAVRTTIARNAGEYMDGFALNADSTLAATGNINSDDALPDADSYYLSAGQDGIRHLYIADSSCSSATWAPISAASSTRLLPAPPARLSSQRPTWATASSSPGRLPATAASPSSSHRWRPRPRLTASCRLPPQATPWASCRSSTAPNGRSASCVR